MHAQPIIRSLQNPKIKQLMRLRKARERKIQQLTLVEGLREIQRAREGAATFEAIYYCASRCSSDILQDYELFCQDEAIDFIPCTEPVFEKITYRAHADGLLGVAHMPSLTLSSLTPSKNPLLLVAENVEKPGNIGTLLRTIDATGADALILIDSQTDITNPNIIRASIGSLFFVPVIETSRDAFFSWCQTHHIHTIALHPDAPSIYAQADLQRPIAICVGAEDKGLSADLLEQAEQQISIPMHGKNDSLNVSTAAAVILYETIRQRNLTQ